MQPDFDVLLKPVVLSNLLFLAVLASLVCYVLWNVVLKQLGTVRASNYIYLNPLVTMVASIIILHEQTKDARTAKNKRLDNTTGFKSTSKSGCSG